MGDAAVAGCAVMPKVLIAGGTGLLGDALLASRPAEWTVRATYHQRPPAAQWRAQFVALDVRDERNVADVVAAARPEIVIHAASIGSVDLAEREPENVRRINIGGLRSVMRACESTGARLVFISSNAVFDGRHPPYDERAPRSAVNTYGRLKIEAEELLESSGLPHVIVRPILMYGWPTPGGRSNAVTRWLDELSAGRPVYVADDIFSMPLPAWSCAEAIWAAVRLNRRGIYHVAGADRVTLAEFARETARVFGVPERLVVPVPNSHFASLAPRPGDTSFVTAKLETDLGIRPIGIHEGLAAMQATRALTR
jgi:dTDP-4-dehydrorhamnose reductase